MRLCVEREIYNEYLILFKTKKRSGKREHTVHNENKENAQQRHKGGYR